MLWNDLFIHNMKSNQWKYCKFKGEEDRQSIVEDSPTIIKINRVNSRFILIFAETFHVPMAKDSKFCYTVIQSINFRN